MEDEAFMFGLSSASASYHSRIKSHFEELCIDLEDVDGDDELKTDHHPCPFCAEDFDLVDLWCHIDLEHPIEAKSGGYTRHKSRGFKLESYPTHSLSEKDLHSGHRRSFPAGSSHVISTSKAARDPFLSFLYRATAADERENLQLDCSSEESIEETHSDQADDRVLERDVQPSLSDKDQIENTRRSEFVQGLLMSTILDPDF